MKNSFLVLLISLLFFNSFAQIKFKKGYFIDKKGDRIEVLIKNSDWRNTPTQIEYKTSETSEKKILSLGSIQEFGIYSYIKFITSTVEIDRSISVINELNHNREPELSRENLMLEVLVEGNASLYKHVDSNTRKYFYKINDKAIEQLIYKKYLSKYDKVAENNKYKKQLFDKLKFEEATINSINNVGYNQDDLVEYFVAYNTSNDSEFINFEYYKSKGDLNLSIRPSIRNSSLSVIDRREIFEGQDYNFDDNLTFSIGLELEYIFGFNGGKWSVLFEPRYQSSKFDTEITRSANGLNPTIEKVSLDYSSIEFSLGWRHYFFLSDNSKLFVNASFIYDYIGKDTILLYDTSISYDLSSAFNISAGFGYKFDDKYSLEFRIQSKRNNLKGDGIIDSKYSSISLILGYTIF